MDDSQFDRLARMVGGNVSRRTTIKAIVAMSGSALLGTRPLDETSAARRPTPTPRPVVCPGSKSWNGTECACPSGSTSCGPDCCPNGQAECCDNACCYGLCYGEEICCPTGRIFCEGVCLPPGVCCSAIDCPEGYACLSGHCVPDTPCQPNGNECDASDECCSGICQSHLCVPTIAGTCQSGPDICTTGPFPPCGTGCACISTSDNTLVCSQADYCAPSCAECLGGLCAQVDCCDDGLNTVGCFLTCSPQGGGS